MSDSLAEAEKAGTIIETTAERVSVEKPDTASDGSFKDDVSGDSSTSDVQDSSPEKEPTLAEILKEQLKESNENNVEDSPDDVGMDPSSGPEPEVKPDATTESTTFEPGKEDPSEISDAELKAMKPEARNRFQKLANERKDAVAENEELRQYRQTVDDTIQAAGLNQDQMADMLEWSRMRQSSDRSDNEKALELAKRMVDELSDQIGVNRPGGDPFSDHKDLQERVDLGEIDQADAEEIALSRSQKTYKNNQDKYRDEVQGEATRQSMELQEAGQGLMRLFDHWRKTDPDWPAKQKEIHKKASRIRSKHHPTKFVEVVKDLYDDLTESFAREKPKPDPRERMPGGSSSANGAKVEHKSARAAIAETLRASRY